MQKTILFTGATDGIGLEAARLLADEGHKILLHGRNPEKLERVRAELSDAGREVEGHVADLSRLAAVHELSEAVASRHGSLDVLVNNAGILRTNDTRTEDGLDVRFAVNTLAPYILTRNLLPLFGKGGRVVNLSSAAQAPVDLEALAGQDDLPAMEAYSQSKLALTMWSRHLAAELGPDGPAIIALNPGSMLGTKMVKEGFGVAGGDVGIGADIIARAATGADFEGASGRYFDNDARRFGNPHPDALNPVKCAAVVAAMDEVLSGVAAS